MNYKRSYPVFADHDGNRFVFPGMYDCVEEGKSAGWGERLTISTALNVTNESNDLLLEFDDGATTIDLLHQPIEIQHSAFAHGSEVVWLIGGPRFDQSNAP